MACAGLQVLTRMVPTQSRSLPCAPCAPSPANGSSMHGALVSIAYVGQAPMQASFVVNPSAACGMHPTNPEQTQVQKQGRRVAHLINSTDLSVLHPLSSKTLPSDLSPLTWSSTILSAVQSMTSTC
jgi:hypothetical protein